MIDVTKPEQILSIKSVGDLFSQDKDKMRYEYKQLAKYWHPDLNSNKKAKEVFQKITDLYNTGISLLSENKWEKSNYISFTTKRGIHVNIDYLSHKYFELGEYYICKDKVIYILNKENELFYDNAISRINSITYSNSDMEKEFSKYFPKISNKCALSDDRLLLEFIKTDDVFLLSDILDYYNGKIPDKHVAWIISRLSNICCFFQYSNLVLNDIDIYSIFISPKSHSIMMLGWWYMTKSNEKMIGTVKNIFNIMPLSVKTTKMSNIITDLESVKNIGKKLLGNSLLTDTTTPNPFIDWLKNGSTNNAMKEFKKWNNTLNLSYGKRTFVPMNISEKDIYKIG